MWWIEFSAFSVLDKLQSICSEVLKSIPEVPSHSEPPVHIPELPKQLPQSVLIAHFSFNFLFTPLTYLDLSAAPSCPPALPGAASPLHVAYACAQSAPCRSPTRFSRRAHRPA